MSRHRRQKDDRMNLITVVISPERERTRILVKSCQTELLRAQLPTLPLPEHRALATLLEGLALAFEQRLCVVLVADERGDMCCSAIHTALVETRPLFYDVGIAVREALGDPMTFEVEDEVDLDVYWGRAL